MTVFLQGLSRLVFIWAIVILSLGDAVALRLDYGTSATMSYSDNINQASENKQEEWVGSGNIGVTVDQESGPIIIDANAFLRYEDFVNDTFSDRFLFSLNNQAEWRITPERFSWTLEDYYTQVSVDAVDPATPDNTQNTNAFSTGPNLVLRLSPRNKLEAGLRYEDIYFEDSDADNIRYSVFASWLLTLTSTREFSVNLSGEKVDFDDEELNDNFTREDYSFAFATRYPRYAFRVELGGTHIQSNSDSTTGYLANAAYTWNLTSLSTVAISVGSQLTDTSRNLLQENAIPIQDDLQTEQVSSDVFREEEVTVAFTKEGDPLRGELDATWIDRDYKRAPLDRVIERVAGNIEYNLTATLVGKIFGDYVRTREITTRRLNNDHSIGAGLIYLIRRNLRLEMIAQYYSRNSNVADGSFHEISGLLGIVYGMDSIFG